MLRNNIVINKLLPFKLEIVSTPNAPVKPLNQLLSGSCSFDSIMVLVSKVSESS